MSLWSMINGHTTHILIKNSYEWPFSIISKANTYGFLTKKWSPPEIQECDLWQGNICGVSRTSLGSMINGHTTPIFVENSHERPISIISKANTYEFFLSRNGLHQKSKNVTYVKETYVGWGVRASDWWSKAIQPPFLSKIAMTDHFKIPKDNTYRFLTKNGLHQKSNNLIYGKEIYVGWGEWACGQRSMATQPPFLSKIAWTTMFHNTEG
jgi:hypothetical protein